MVTPKKKITDKKGGPYPMRRVSHLQNQLTQPPSGGQTQTRSCTKAMWCVAQCPPEQLAHPLNLTFSTTLYTDCH